MKSNICATMICCIQVHFDDLVWTSGHNLFEFGDPERLTNLDYSLRLIFVLKFKICAIVYSVALVSTGSTATAIYIYAAVPSRDQ